jgi:hypothetical protein
MKTKTAPQPLTIVDRDALTLRLVARAFDDSLFGLHYTSGGSLGGLDDVTVRQLAFNACALYGRPDLVDRLLEGMKA